MALSTVETQVTWAAASSKTVSAVTEQLSDVFTLSDDCVNFSIQVHADNQSTASDGDLAKFRLQWTSGDILGDTGNDFDTSEHSTFLGTLDTYAANTPGENPAGRTYHPGVGGARTFRVGVTCPTANLRNIVVRARVVEQRSA